MFQIVTDFGLQNYNNRSISLSEARIHTYFPAILIIKTALAILFLALIYLVGWLIGYSTDVLKLLAWIGINTIMASMILYLRTNISGKGYYTRDSLLSVLDRVLMIGIIGYWLYASDDFVIEDFIYGQSIALLVSMLIIGMMAYRMARPLSWPKSLKVPVDLLRDSLPYAVVILLMTIYTRIDVVMIERILPDGLYEAGVYASGYRLFDAANMFGFLVAGLLLPMFSRLIAREENTFPLFKLSLRGVWLIAVFGTTSCFVFRQELVQLLYTNADAYWGEVLGCLMLSFLFVMVGYITGSLLTANGNIHKLKWIFAVSIALNVTLNWFLIHQYQAYGAALATLFTQAFVVLAQLFYVNRTMHFSISNYPARSMIFGSLLLLLGMVGLRNVADTGTEYIIGLGLIGILLLIYLAIFTYRAVDQEKINIHEP